MTREEIVRLAKEHFGVVLYPSDLAVKLALVASEKQRQACSKVCEDVASKYAKQHYADAENIADECVAAIRARGETK